MAKHWTILYTKDALKDKRLAYETGFQNKIEGLIDLLKVDPFKSYPPYEKLLGDLSGAFSRRINVQHRLVYSIHKEEMKVKIISLWTHYE